METTQDNRKNLAAEPEAEPVKLESIEQYQIQMAAIAAAAHGYWNEEASVHPDYDTVVLRDVAKLYAKYQSLYTRPEPARKPMTEEEIDEVASRLKDARMSWGFIDGIRFAEKHHGIGVDDE